MDATSNFSTNRSFADWWNPYDWWRSRSSIRSINYKESRWKQFTYIIDFSWEKDDQNTIAHLYQNCELLQPLQRLVTSMSLHNGWVQNLFDFGNKTIPKKWKWPFARTIRSHPTSYLTEISVTNSSTSSSIMLMVSHPWYSALLQLLVNLLQKRSQKWCKRDGIIFWSKPSRREKI